MILHCGSVTFLGGKSPDGLVGTWRWGWGGDPPSPLQCYGKGRGPTITPKVVHMGGWGGCTVLHMGTHSVPHIINNWPIWSEARKTRWDEGVGGCQWWGGVVGVGGGEQITSVTHPQSTDQIFMGMVGDHHSVADGHQQEELLDTLHVGRDHHLHALQAAQTHVGQLALQCRLQGQVLNNLKTQTSTTKIFATWA